MRIVRVWLLAGLVAVAILGVLWAAGILGGNDLRDAARMTFSAIIILALAHYAWTLVRGRASGPDRTDKPVP